ncbi:hypothetical protein WH47_10169 [Habropoda laboriosa]|uniref:Uncharacterized protein n=1 Tax=Habropoda laboriosa TaxID=597456 RepID=A0A0L7R4A2_9HYME|nr:hypothetical protein WH47_10169 [Habropoda laboriosa]
MCNRHGTFGTEKANWVAEDERRNGNFKPVRGYRQRQKRVAQREQKNGEGRTVNWAAGASIELATLSPVWITWGKKWLAINRVVVELELEKGRNASVPGKSGAPPPPGSFGFHGNADRICGLKPSYPLEEKPAFQLVRRNTETSVDVPRNSWDFRGGAGGDGLRRCGSEFSVDDERQLREMHVAKDSSLAASFESAKRVVDRGEIGRRQKAPGAPGWRYE